MTPVRVEVWGAHAQRFAERHAAARIAAVFARSLHLEADGDFLCLGDPSIGRGPLNAIVGGESWARLRRAVPPAGATALIDRLCICIGDVAIDRTGAALWRPAPWPNATDRRRVAEAVDELAQLCIARAPEDGLARIPFEPASFSSSALARVARIRVNQLRAWLDDGGGAPPVDLLGLGPGLTPSGDDVLCGALIALRAVGRTGAARRLAAAVGAAAAAATSPISGAFLRAAAEGLGAEPLHEIIRELLSGGSDALPRHLDALGRIGHTSGWDALAGAMLVLQAFSTSAVQRAGVARPELSL